MVLPQQTVNQDEDKHNGSAVLQRLEPGCRGTYLQCCSSLHRIAPTLTMMRDYVDYWAVLVTNTSDNTSAVVNSIMKPVPGQVVEEKTFTDFASARNKIFQVCAPCCACLMSCRVLHGMCAIAGSRPVLGANKHVFLDCGVVMLDVNLQLWHA